MVIRTLGPAITAPRLERAAVERLHPRCRRGRGWGLPSARRSCAAGSTIPATPGCMDAEALENLIDGTSFDHVSAVHHDDPLSALGDHSEVMRDEDHPHPGLLLKRSQQCESRSLDRHIKRCRGLICQQEARSSGEREGDCDSLTHAAR